MAGKKKAAKATEPLFTEIPTVRLEFKTNQWNTLEMEVHQNGITLDPTNKEGIEILWARLPNFLAALTRAQEIHAGQKTAELPLFGEGPAPGVTQADLDDDPEDYEEDDDDE